MKQNLHLHLLSVLAAMSIPALSMAADFRAVQSGSWSDPATWGLEAGAALPGAEDTVFFNDGVSVTLTDEVTISTIGYTNNNTASAYLNISGPSAVLNVTSGQSQFWYNNRLNISLTDGATMTAGSISWGDGGYSNIYIENSSYTGVFDQFRGSLVDEGSFLSLKSTNGATSQFVASGDLRLNPTSDGYKMNVTASGKGANFNMNGKTFALNAQKGTANLVVSDGALFTGQNIEVENNEGATNSISVFGSGTNLDAFIVRVGSGSKAAAAAGSSSTLNLGGFDSNGNFVAAGPSAVTNNWEFFVTESGRVNFYIGAENLSATQSLNLEDAILAGEFVKTFEGALSLDFSYVDTSNIADGSYYVSLISSTETLFNGKDFVTSEGFTTTIDDWLEILEVKDGENVKFEDLILSEDTKIMYALVNVTSAVPEPSTYALIFGAISLIFVLKRRRAR